MEKYKAILAEIVRDKHDWRGVKTELSKFNVHSLETSEKDTRAGKIFELFTKYFFLASPGDRDNFKNVWLFDETPLEIRNKLNVGNQDYGVDLILQDHEDQLFVVQCKFKNDEESKLNWSADKIANLFAFCPKADGYIIFSNVTDLDSVSKTRHDNFTFYSIANLNEIEPVTFSSIYSLLTENKLKERKLFEPKSHQEKAIQQCVEFFEIENRGQLIFPCGAGKTLTALWIKERLNSESTLVLVPSLALLRQIKNEWAKQKKTDYQYLCVCSESDIDNDNTDSIVTHFYEVDVRVTTDYKHVQTFLKKPIGERVVFSTYHSLPVVADAIKGTNFEFDFVFCDEAHKTAGVGMNKYSLVHDNNLIPSKRRLYATATPRIVKETLKKKLGDNLKYAYDMNDPNIFGYEFYRMTFKEAIEENILVDYKIVAIGISNDELKEYIEQRRFVDSKISIDELANNYALEHTMKNYNANHGLTFHSRVKLAQEFAKRHSQLFESTNAFSVSGEQPTSSRNLVLEQFKNSQKAIVSNARCLTEGVDVPAIDLVYFCDPKNSKVDIVQAVGRALRKKEGKKIGLVVVPVFHTKKEEVEDSISSGSFRNLLQIIRSLSDQDERLQDEINLLAFGNGKRKSDKIDFVSSNFSEEKATILLDGFEDKLRKSLFDQIIEKASNNWDLWFLKLKEFLNTNKEYPSDKDDIELYRWVAQQRNKKSNGFLKNEEIRKLNEIDFIWNYQDWKWDSMFKELESYSLTHNFEPHKEEYPELASWYISQKTQLKKKSLSKYRIKLLTSIKFEGSHKDRKLFRMFEEYKKYSELNEFEPDNETRPNLTKWMKGQKSQIRSGSLDSEKTKLFNSIVFKPLINKKWMFSYESLIEFKKENPSKWPNYDRKNPKSLESKLSVFCQYIRNQYRENLLDNFWFEKMAEIDFNFEGKIDNWTQNFEEIKNLINDKDTISSSEIGKAAYSWVTRYRIKYEEGKLSDYQTKKIEELKLDRFFESWEEKFDKVAQWVEEKGKIPTKLANSDFNVWLYSQRGRYKNGTLTDEQIEKLNKIGFDLKGLGTEKNEKKWVERLNQYAEFIKTNNREPSYFGEELEKTLYLWGAAQRAVKAGNARKRKPLSKKREQALNSIDFNWVGQGKMNQSWEATFNEFSEYVTNGNLNLPTMINGERNQLYTWWNNQKVAFRNNSLEEERANKLIGLGLDLKMKEKANEKNWEENFNDFKTCFDETGILRLPYKIEGKVNPLYVWFRNQKTAFKKGAMALDPIEKFRSVGIDLSETSPSGRRQIEEINSHLK